jgi:hypothetical protein
MNAEIPMAENRTLFHSCAGNTYPACGGLMREVERIPEFRFTYILYRCGSPDCRKEFLDKRGPA